MTKAELKQLILEYGDASFDCGAWDGQSTEDYESGPYAAHKAAKKALFAALDIELEPAD